MLEQLLVGKAIVDGPMKANSTSLKGARIYRQSEVLIQGYLEVCNQQRTYKAWAAFHVHQVTLKVVTPLIPLQAWGRNFLAQVQTLESGRLVGFLGHVLSGCLYCFCHNLMNPANIQASFSLLNKRLLPFFVCGAVTVTVCQQQTSKPCLAGAESGHHCHIGSLHVHQRHQA